MIVNIIQVFKSKTTLFKIKNQFNNNHKNIMDIMKT